MGVDQSYIRDVMAEIADINNAEFHNDTDRKKRTVNGINLRDPDHNCGRLYDDVNRIFSMEN